MTCIVLLSRDIGGIPIDVVITESHESEMEIAEHPVERGASISDHAWRKPREVSIEGLVDTPLAQAAFAGLLALQDNPEPFDVVTGLRLYPSMLLQSLSAERDVEHGRVLKFTAKLKEVIIVSTGSTGAPSDGGRASGTQARGQVQARQMSNADVSRIRTKGELSGYAWNRN
jgi:hypothetical protein